MGQWVVALFLSIALHAAAALTVTRMVGEPGLPPLLVDLTAIAAEDERTGASKPAPPVAATPPKVAARSARPGGRREGPAPAPRSLAPSEALPSASARSPSAPPASAPPERVPPADAAPDVSSPPAPTPAAPVPSPSAEPDRPDVSASASPAPAPSGAEPVVSPSPGAPGVDATATRGGGTDRAASPHGRAAGPSNGGEGREGQGTASGAATALAVPGSGGAAGDYEGYYARLRARLKEVLRYPPVARRRGLEGTVHLDIDVEPSGAIGAVTVVSSSSHDVLDRAAVDAVRSMSRVPFPSDVRPRPLKVRLPVVFALP